MHLYLLPFDEIPERNRAISEENPLEIVYGFAYTIDYGVYVVGDRNSVFFRNFRSFFVEPFKLPVGILFFTYGAAGVRTPHAVYVIVG